VDVFQELGQFRDLGGGHRHDLIDGCRVKLLAHGETFGRGAADHFRDRARLEIRVAGILAFRRVDQVEILPDRQVPLEDEGLDDLVRRAGIGGAFQRQQLARAQMGRDLLHRADDEGQVGFAMLAERRGHADDDRVHLADPAELGGCLETGFGHRRDAGAGDVADRAAALVQRGNPIGVDVESENTKAGIAEAQRQGNADIAEPDYADDGFSRRQLFA
jgi:hypothetical protein